MMKSDEEIFFRTIGEHRAIVSKLKARFPHANIPYEDFNVRVNRNFSANVRVYRPATTVSKTYRTLFFIRGTAFVAKETDITHMVCSHIAKIACAQVIVLDHRLAPEVKLPRQFQDILGLYTTILDDTLLDLKIDRQHICISGYSSGANFAALLGMLAGQCNHQIKSLILLSPIVDLSRNLKKYECLEKQDATITQAFVNWFLHQALPEETERYTKLPLISPFWMPKKCFRQLPRTTVMVGEIDRFRSDAEAFCEKIQLCGKGANKFVLPEKDHGFLWSDFNSIELFGAIAAMDLRKSYLSKGLSCQFYVCSDNNPYQKNNGDEVNYELSNHTGLFKPKL